MEIKVLSRCIVGAFAKLRKGTITLVMSVRPNAWNKSARVGKLVMKYYIG